MTDVLQRYGIKEVADVTFYHINKDTNEPDYPVLVLDSLKVTSIEQTAETSEARGGKGNAKLIVWDFGKEITVNIEDALFSPKSFSLMFADGSVETISDSSAAEKKLVRRSARVVCTEDGVAPIVKIDGNMVDSGEVYLADLSNTGISFYVGGSTKPIDTTTLKKGQVCYAVWHQAIASKSIITITPDSFPGTYYVTGDTMVRSERNGEDEYFQFIIPKAKMQAEQTISMEAEGDPSTFNMSLQVLRPENGEMIQFIQYNFANELDTRDDNDTSLLPDLGDGWTKDEETAKQRYFYAYFVDNGATPEKRVASISALVDTTKVVEGGTIPAAAFDAPEKYNTWVDKNDNAASSITLLTENTIFYRKSIKPIEADD